MTASEPLSLDEEYAMQKSWKEDPKKCTFIILARGRVASTWMLAFEDEEPQMAGDVNLFFNDLDDKSICEVEVMVAEERWRRKGLAREALLMIMRYGLDELGAKTFYCKIGDANQASRALFDKLGYARHAYVEVFKETELRFVADEAGAATLRAQTSHVEVIPCPPPTDGGDSV
ncbi:unnamed protein product [Sphacelaria rigidula]